MPVEVPPLPVLPLLLPLVEPDADVPVLPPPEDVVGFALAALPEEEPDVEPVVPVLLPLVEPDADVPVLPPLEDVPGSALAALPEEEPDVEPVVPVLATVLVPWTLSSIGKSLLRSGPSALIVALS